MFINYDRDGRPTSTKEALQLFHAMGVPFPQMYGLWDKSVKRGVELGYQMMQEERQEQAKKDAAELLKQIEEKKAIEERRKAAPPLMPSTPGSPPPIPTAPTIQPGEMQEIAAFGPTLGVGFAGTQTGIPSTRRPEVVTGPSERELRSLVEGHKLPNVGLVAMETPQEVADTVSYVGGRVLSSLEKDAYGITEFILRGARAISEDFTMRSPGWLTNAIDFYSQPEVHGLITPKMTEARGERREAAYSQSFARGILQDIGENALDFVTLALMMRAISAGLGASAQLLDMDKAAMLGDEFMAASSKSGRAAASKAMGELAVKGEAVGSGTLMPTYTHLLDTYMGYHPDALRRNAAMWAGHALATTPGDIEARAGAALKRIAYNITPYLANATGATGLTAVAVDAMLNTMLTSPVYYQTIKEHGFNEEAMATIIPNMVMDIGMAWSTRGLPENQAEKVWANRKNFIKGEAPSQAEVNELYRAMHGVLGADPEDLAKRTFTNEEFGRSLLKLVSDDPAKAETELAERKKARAREFHQERAEARETTETAFLERMTTVQTDTRPDFEFAPTHIDAVIGKLVQVVETPSGYRVLGASGMEETSGERTLPERYVPLETVEGQEATPRHLQQIPQALRPRGVDAELIPVEPIPQALRPKGVDVELIPTFQQRPEDVPDELGMRDVRPSEPSAMEQVAPATIERAVPAEEVRADEMVRGTEGFVERPVPSGFRDTTEVYMAIEAENMGHERWRASFDEIDKNVLRQYTQKTNPDEIYKDLVQKAATIDPETKEMFQFDLQMFAEKGWTKEQIADARKLIKDLKKIDVKHLRPEYKEEVEKLLDPIDWQVMHRSKKTMRSLERTREYLERNPDNVLPDYVMKKLALLDKTPITDMSYQDFVDITDAVKHFVHLNKTKNKLIAQRELRDLERVVDESVEMIRKAHNVTVQVENDIGPIEFGEKEPRVGVVKDFYTAQSEIPEFMTERIQGAKEGPVKDILYDAIDKGMSEHLRLYFEAQSVIDEVIRAHREEIDTWSRTFNPGKKLKKATVEITNGRKVTLTPDDRMDLYMNSKNELNRLSLLEGGFRLEGNPSVLHRINETDLDIILATMSPLEKQLCDVAQMQMDKQYEVINDVHVQLHGFELGKQENYWPIIRYDNDYRVEPLVKGRGALYRALEQSGFLKPRGEAPKPLLLSGFFDTYRRSVSGASAFAGLAVPLRNARAFMQDPSFDATVRQAGLSHYTRELNTYLNDVEGPIRNTSQAAKDGLDWLGRIQLSILAFDPFIALKQVGSYASARYLIDEKHLFKAIPMSTKGVLEELYELSPQLRYRSLGHIDREMGELVGHAATRQFFTDKKSFAQKATGMISAADAYTIAKLWNATKLQVKAENPGLEGEALAKAAVPLMEKVVNQTQPSFLPHTRSAIGRSPDLHVRAVTSFTTQLNKNYNITKQSWWDYQTSDKSNADKSLLAKRLFSVAVVNGLYIASVNRLKKSTMRTLRQEEKEPEEDMKFALNLGLDLLETALGSVYLVGDGFSSIRSKVQKGKLVGHDMDSLILNTLATGTGAVFDVYNTIDQIITGEKYKAGPKKGRTKWETTMRNAVVGLGITTSRLFGLPIEKPLYYGAAVLKGFEPKTSKGRTTTPPYFMPGLQPLTPSRRQSSSRRSSSYSLPPSAYSYGNDFYNILDALLP